MEVRRLSDHDDPVGVRARMYAALGDRVRLRILDLIDVGDLSPQDLAASLQIAPNLLGHHLRVLEEAGVIRRVVSEGDRRRSYIHTIPEAFTALVQRPRVIVVARILFVCTKNSARSVLAEAVWRTASAVPVASAGTKPASAIHPLTRGAGNRAGIPISDTGPRHVDDVATADDLVISTCDGAREALARVRPPHLHWSIADPVRRGTPEAFDEAVVELRRRIARFAQTVRCA